MKIDLQPGVFANATRGERTSGRLETAFLAEMLKTVMPDGSRGAFGGGVGESQFASFMTEQHAEALAARLDLGLTSWLERRDA